MTLDQLKEANLLRTFAEATNDKCKNFRKEVGKDISFGSCNATSLQGSGGYYLNLESRPEVSAAAKACEAIMQQALDAEAARWAKAFDEFEIKA